jgi:hypothetical protein
LRNFSKNNNYNKNNKQDEISEYAAVKAKQSFFQANFHEKRGVAMLPFFSLVLGNRI